VKQVQAAFEGAGAVSGSLQYVRTERRSIAQPNRCAGNRVLIERMQ
jgi:hypothetical protein